MEVSNTMRRIHIIGRKNSGKTTLVVELVQELTSRGLKIATVKHTHHHHELDTPGKDSFRHREAGAAAVGILAPAMNAVFWPAPPTQPECDRYDQFDPLLADCDLVLVEGHSQVEGIKVEVWRSVTASPPYAAEDLSIRAVVSDDSVPCPVDIWPRSGIAELADRILQLQ
jgi:molybdopterin-guanine dinucleotide biosynthesis adapter protein